jgi:hypothetical protein
MMLIILIWAAVWLLPFLLTRTFTSVLPSMPTFIVVAGCGFLILMFLTNITLLILANVYSNYELRTRLTLDTTFYLLDTHWDSNGNLIRVPTSTRTLTLKNGFTYHFL